VKRCSEFKRVSDTVGGLLSSRSFTRVAIRYSSSLADLFRHFAMLEYYCSYQSSTLVIPLPPSLREVCNWMGRAKPLITWMVLQAVRLVLSIALVLWMNSFVVLVLISVCRMSDASEIPKYL